MKKTKNAPDTPASSIANGIAAHPFVDAVASLAVSVSWYMLGCRAFDFEEPCAELFTSLSSVSGLLMAAATFYLFHGISVWFGTNEICDSQVFW